MPAWADDALVLGTRADGDTHDEEQTLGWLVRRGDFWYSTNPGSEYSVENGKPLFCMVDDRAYDCRIQVFDEQGRPVEYNEDPLLVYYYDGDMVFQKGSYLDLEKVVNLGEEAHLSDRLMMRDDFAYMLPPEESTRN